jgi:hypothetical protein
MYLESYMSRVLETRNNIRNKFVVNKSYEVNQVYLIFISIYIYIYIYCLSKYT